MFSPSLRTTIAAALRLPGGDRFGRRRRIGRAVAVVLGRRVRGRALDRVECGEDPLPERGAAGGDQPVDRGEDLGLLAGRIEDREAGIAERDHPDDDAGRLALHHRAGERLRGIEACGLDVVRGHAPGDVEGEHDGALDARQGDRRLRAGESDDENDETGDDEPGGERGGEASEAAARAAAGAGRG